VTGRNALIVIVTGVLAMMLGDTNPFTLTSEIKQGLPDFVVPKFSVEFNSTVVKDFPTALSEISSGVAVIALIGLMETVAVAKAFMPSKKLDSTQEMIALGLCNILGSFVSAFPATGSFSRSAVNHTSGVRTPLGGIMTGGLVLLALALLAPFFEFIPQTALSSIIIAAVVPMVRFDDPITVWKSNKIDLIPYVATIASCLYWGLEYGIVIGVVLSVVILLYQMARPRISVVVRMTPDGDNFLYVKPDRSIFFPSIEYMKVKLRQALPALDESPKNCIVIDGEHMFRSDSTFGVGIKNMVENFRKQSILIIFYNLRKPVLRAIRGSGLKYDDFAFCQSEDDVYNKIRNYCRIAATRMSTGTITPSDLASGSGSLPSNPSHRYWASQSYEV
jgi:sodium-independent sulfate anion transporter 11